MATDPERLLQAISIESYIQRFIPLKRKGNNLWARCPFHSEKSASLSVSPEKGIFKCFGCGKGGNLITFVQLYENVDFPQALKILSDYSGIALTGFKSETDKKKSDIKEPLFVVSEIIQKLYSAQVNHPDSIQYIRSRGITDESINKFKIGYAPPDFRFLERTIEEHKNIEGFEKSLYDLGLLVKTEKGDVYNRFRDRIIFPIYNINSRCIAFGGRIFQEGDKQSAKYINSPESPVFQKKQTLYNLHQAKTAIRSSQVVILVEGYLDVVGLSQVSIENVVAPLGTSFTDEQAKLLKRYSDNLIIFFDADNAGIDAAYRALLTARNYNLNIRVVIPGKQIKAKDPFDLSKELEPIELLSYIDNAVSELNFILWYFLKHKYNIQKMEEKRSAIKEFFQFASQLKEEWEREDYIKELASIIDTSPILLGKDFKRFLQGHAPVNEESSINESPVQKKDLSRLEKEILALLLRFPAFWEKESLLSEINWVEKEFYLLYIFFRDRLKGGEFWKWKELNSAMIHLPEELGSVLSTIIMELDPVFQNDTGEENLIQEEYSRRLEKLVMLHKRNKIEQNILKKQKELSTAEKLTGENIEDIAEELNHLILDKIKIDHFLQSH